MYSISEVAEQLDIKPHTLRYYEREGIIEPDRNKNGIRYFTEAHVNWLNFVKKLRETQMPITQIKEYATLYLEGEHTSLQRLQLLENHQRSIQEQIHNLKTTDEMLERKISLYKEHLRTKEPK
ncbi:MerR family transcriptional regulator [Pontibacillus yanchengensis]|uniref:MerR family transcriptional regulator n=2 Tax=Pontibacillus yanchengensis TaxID=462910 RepID=A0ACC7VLW1_9BACI|nr:MerR family transcriptional regulator [Pontibacillus yanchengensis]MYL32620.1 MerR family transcriptional regulator [Pontibacillus yanchengensis]MYL55014.1 MerR family transcriptional regulator [Pontibacillus yanchengensis]